MIRLLELSIQAFRGIPDKLTLDVSGPLTLIYAPNGSGKTTICEAAEWLLTGAVKRLEATSDDGELRCRFSPASLPTTVGATLEVGGKLLELQRQLDGWCWRTDSDDWKAVNQSDLLERLAPSAQEEGVHRKHANRSRQIWLRGTRFLSGEALGTLLDSDSDSLATRERLFADLLGVGHLLETERQLDGYVSELSPHLREQQVRLEEKDREIGDRKIALDDQLDVNLPERLGAAAEYLANAAKLLESELALNAALDRSAAKLAISRLRALCEGRETRWEQKRRAELELATDWGQRDELAASFRADQLRLASLSEEERTNAAALEAVSEQQRAAEAALRSEALGLKRLADCQNGVMAAQSQAEPLIRHYLATSGEADLHVGAAFAILDEEGTDSNLKLRLSKLQEILTELPDVLALQSELSVREREYELAAEAAPTSDAVLAIQTTLESANERLKVKRAAYENAAAPVEQLQFLSATVIESLRDESHCPVCAHDWKSGKDLRRAMSEAASSTPTGLAALQKELRNAELEQEAIRIKLVQQNELLAHVVDADRKCRQLQTSIKAFQDKVRAIGLSEGAPELRTEAEKAVARVNLVTPLRVLRERTREAEALLSYNVPNDTSVASLFQHLRPVLGTALESAEAKHAQAASRLSSLEGEIALHTEVVRKLKTERELLERRVKQRGSRLQVLRASWQTLAGDEQWSDAALERVSEELLDEHRNCLSAGQLLAQAESVLREVDAFEELQGLQAERKLLAAEVERLANYAEGASSIREAYRNFRQEHAGQQMREFIRVISALFSRMQSNLVYDDVECGAEEAPLSWRAIADELVVDPVATFSQGQRQDFALSIFLARARGLGGTFVLDEPVAHLDDLNRVALLDVFRAVSVESVPGLSFVLTTANKPLVRHMVEKFSRVSSASVSGGRESVLNLVSLEGNPRIGLRVRRDAEFASII